VTSPLSLYLLVKVHMYMYVHMYVQMDSTYAHLHCAHFLCSLFYAPIYPILLLNAHILQPFLT
jgi:hypothetical protein